MAPPPTRWGIASAGKVSNDFVTCLRHMGEGEHKIIAVADQNLITSQPFARKFNIPRAYSSYAELAVDPDVEIVYVSSLNPQHYEVAKMMLLAGRHVLCEKPFCMDPTQTRDLIRLARENKCFLMEGLWGRFFPVYEQLRKELTGGSIGQPQIVTVCFGSAQNDVERLKKLNLGGGALLDIGVYALQLIVMVFDGAKPQKVIASGILNENGVDDTVSMTLLFSGGRMATLTISQKTPLQNDAIIAGSKGTIKIASPFWCPVQLVTPNTKLDFPLPDIKSTFNFTNSAGFCYEATAVREYLLADKLESPVVPLAHTQLIGEITAEALRQLGVDHPKTISHTTSSW